MFQDSLYDSCCYSCYTLRPNEIHIEIQGQAEMCKWGHWPGQSICWYSQLLLYSNMFQDSLYDSCCYSCYTLRPNEIHIENQGRAEMCERGSWPDPSRQSCQRIEVEFGFRASSPPGKVKGD
jgi:hypothetical protein